MIPSNGIQLGIVVACYPAGNAVDVLLPDSGSRLAGIQVMLASGSDSTGTFDLPDPGLPQDDTRWNLPSNPTRNMIAIVSSYKGQPVCTGFIVPQISQMTFDRKNFRVFRHASDVYSTINSAGDTEVYHPSGSYVRIGASAAHEDLTGQDVDQLWKIAANTTAAPSAKVVIANAGVVKATFLVDSSGNVTVTAQGNISVTGQGTLTANVSGNTTLTVGGTLTGHVTGAVALTAPQFTFTGPVTFSGNVGITGVLAVTGSITVNGVGVVVP